MKTSAHGSRGDWIQTFTGKKVYPFGMALNDLDIIDIAASQSKMCRFGGHPLRFVSVAEHSVIVLRELERVVPRASMRLRRQALLHDASEAYLVGDVPRPIKSYLAGYREAEMAIMRLVARRYWFDWPSERRLHDLDASAMKREIVDNMPPGPLLAAWRDVLPTRERLKFWSPDEAMAEFLREARRCDISF